MAANESDDIHLDRGQGDDVLMYLENSTNTLRLNNFDYLATVVIENITMGHGRKMILRSFDANSS